MTPNIEFNPFTPEVVANPYPHYKRLRREAPVYYFEPAKLWIITRYDDNVFALQNPQLFSSTAIMEMFAGEFDPFPGDDGVQMMSSDPPQHTRLRRLVSTAFTPRAVAGLRGTIEAFVEQRIQSLRAQEEYDFVTDLVAPLPVKMFFTLVGVPEDQQERARLVSEGINASSQALSGAAMGADWKERIKQAQLALVQFLFELVELRRAQPGDDLTSALIAASDEGDKLTPIEVLKLVHLLFTAGTESTTSFIPNMLLALLENPEQYQKLRSNPALIPIALQEALRYDGPALHMGRKLMEDVELSGTVLPKGARCLMSYASANHDETKFTDPERFDLGRVMDGRPPLLSFGFGIHRCLGSTLATLQAEVVLRKLIQHYAGFSWDPNRVERATNTFFLRGVKHLPISPLFA